MERHARGAAQQILDPIWVFHAGQGHQDARLPLAGDECLGDARFIHAAADDFNGLFDRRTGLGAQPCLRKARGDSAIWGGGDLNIRDILAGGECHGFGQFTQSRSRGADLRCVQHAETHAAVRPIGGQIHIADIGGAELAAHAIHRGFQPFPHNSIQIHFQQQIGPAAQIEAEADLAGFHPGWKGRTRHEVRQAQKHPEQTNAENDSLFPAREMKHGRVESPG